MTDEINDVEDPKYNFLKKRYSLQSCLESPSIYNPMLCYIFELLERQEKAINRMADILENAFPVDRGPGVGDMGGPDISESGTSSGTTVLK